MNGPAIQAAIRAAGAAEDSNPDNPPPNEEQRAKNRRNAAFRFLLRLRQQIRHMFPDLRDDASTPGPLLTIDAETAKAPLDLVTHDKSPKGRGRIAVDAVIVEKLATDGEIPRKDYLYFHVLRKRAGYKRAWIIVKLLQFFVLCLSLNFCPIVMVMLFQNCPANKSKH